MARSFLCIQQLGSRAAVPTQALVYPKESEAGLRCPSHACKGTDRFEKGTGKTNFTARSDAVYECRAFCWVRGEREAELHWYCAGLSARPEDVSALPPSQTSKARSPLSLFLSVTGLAGPSGPEGSPAAADPCIPPQHPKGLAAFSVRQRLICPPGSKLKGQSGNERLACQACAESTSHQASLKWGRRRPSSTARGRGGCRHRWMTLEGRGGRSMAQYELGTPHCEPVVSLTPSSHGFASHCRLLAFSPSRPLPVVLFHRVGLHVPRDL